MKVTGDLIRLQNIENVSIIDGILIMETMKKNMALCHVFFHEYLLTNGYRSA